MPREQSQRREELLSEYELAPHPGCEKSQMRLPSDFVLDRQALQLQARNLLTY